jgi:hypothetical protein
MSKVHSEVINKFLSRERIRTANFSVETKAFYLVDKPGQFELITVLYSYGLPVAIIDSNGKKVVGNYIREISATTTAQIRALVKTLEDLNLDYEMMSIKDFKKFVSETI